ncbi:MAG: Acetyl-CoA:oxalate CoA-transferase [Alphaproteobacteria bacterium MarineAlpha1_Bin1]|nr:MAG: Acetyl-CoA:oxalate CoA-transferase [Alphaproteobacteria bacterium MarineAlpha1_Bin1]
MSASAYPLDGITVLDFGQIYNGPYASFMLAMSGARVIKIEPPHGEPLRRRTAADGGSVPLAMLNANKEGVTLNLKHERGREMLCKMVMKADVLLENFAPTVMTRLGVGPEALMAINPALIYASGSGYGWEGPRRDDLAMDLTVQAVGGVMHVTGFPDGPPVKAGPAICDFITGTHLYGAVVTALFERTRTGKGRMVEVSMLDSIFPTLASNLGMYFGQKQKGGEILTRTGNKHGGLSVAPYNVYAAKDGYVAIITVREDHWQNLLVAMGREDLKDNERYLTSDARVLHMDEVDEIVGAWVATLTKYEAEAAAQKHHVPTAAVRDLEEVVNDPHLHQRGMLRWVDHPVVGRIAAPHSPIRIQGNEPMELTLNPELGQDNDQVYGKWLGLDPDEIASLREAGAI